MNKARPPKKRDGYRWEWRDGCQCEGCPSAGFCVGDKFPHWIEVKEEA